MHSTVGIIVTGVAGLEGSTNWRMLVRSSGPAVAWVGPAVMEDVASAFAYPVSFSGGEVSWVTPGDTQVTPPGHLLNN